MLRLARTRKLLRARDLTGRATDLALQRGSKGGASEYSASHALWEAAYGDCGRAQETVARTLAIARGRRALSLPPRMNS